MAPKACGQRLALVSFVCVLACLVRSTCGTNRAEFVRTPFGYYHRSCVHAVPEGAVVRDLPKLLRVDHPDGTYAEHKLCEYKPLAHTHEVGAGQGNGWQAYTVQNAGKVTALIGQWTVPQDPPEFDEQTIFLFTGLQNIDWVPPDPQPSKPFDIIQPVLQYGPSAAGGWDYWTIASWYVTLTNDVVYSPLKEVKPGSVIFGNMTQVGADSWYINTLDTNSGVKTDVTIKRSILDAQPWIYVTLEAYGIYSCDLFPGDDVPFTALRLYVDGQLTTPQWKTATKDPICASKATVSGPADVTISFK